MCGSNRGQETAGWNRVCILGLQTGKTPILLLLQGLGLYAARDIEKHTMVIEYIGTIIRNEVANRKEKLYESQASALSLMVPERPSAGPQGWGSGTLGWEGSSKAQGVGIRSQDGGLGLQRFVSRPHG